jgi:hypothetical protein
LPNGLRYLRWGGDGEAVQPEKCSGVGNCLRLPQNPQRQVHALLGNLMPNEAIIENHNHCRSTQFYYVFDFSLAE